MILDASASKINTKTFVGVLHADINIHETPSRLENAAFTVTKDDIKYVFGGIIDGNYSSKLYRHDNEGWTQIIESKNSPSARENAHFLTDHLGKIYLLGGNRFDNIFKELFQYCVKKNEWRKLKIDFSSFPSITDYSVFFDRKNQKIFIFGGKSSSKYINDIYVININDLTLKKIETKGDKPSPRSNSLLYMDKHETLYAFAGKDSRLSINNEVFSLELSNLTWKKLDVKTETSLNYGEELRGVGCKDHSYFVSSKTSKAYEIIFDNQSASIKELEADLKQMPKNIHGFSLAKISSKIFVFGGCNNKKECNEGFFEISTKVQPISLINRSLDSQAQIQIAQKEDDLIENDPETTIEPDKNNESSITEEKPKKKKSDQKKKEMNKPSMITFAYNDEVFTKTENCVDDCSGNGQCFNSQCYCNSGFTGNSCSISNQTAKENGYSFSENIKYMIALAGVSFLATVVVCYYNRKKE